MLSLTTRKSWLHQPRSSPACATSTVTGDGLPELAAALSALLAETEPGRDDGFPYLPVDRVFSRPGFGTVVTGTLRRGPLAVGDTVEIAPGGRTATVRGLQIHGRAVERAEPGRRTAVALRGIDLDQIARGQALSLPERLALAEALWQTDIHEARIAAAKLLTQARLRPDDAVWALICTWVPDFDAWAIADHACMAGQRRLSADPSRLDQVETWTASDHLWTRRAALVITLPWAKLRHPKPAQEAERHRVLGWAAGYVDDPAWFIQKSVAWWLRDLSKHAPELTRAFLAQHGARLKPFACREAGKYLSS